MTNKPEQPADPQPVGNASAASKPGASQPLSSQANAASDSASNRPQRKIGRYGVVEATDRPNAWQRFRETFRKYPLWFSATAGVLLLMVIWSVTRPDSSKRLFEEAEFGLEERSNKQLENVTSMLGHLEDFQFRDISPTLVERLNQWLDSKEDQKDSWKFDPFIAEAIQKQIIPQPFQNYYRTSDALQFTLDDGWNLQEAVWCRNIGDGLGRDGLDNLSLARALFDWTIRNIQLEDTTEEKVIDDSSRSLLLGRGEPMTRAWVFMLLARQQNLDVVMLAYPDPQQPGRLRPWIPAVLHEGELYLFDHNLGLPIPGPDGAPVATLSQVAADDNLLRQLDLTSQQIRYPVRAADVQNVVALMEVSPHFISRRMYRLERELAGRDQLVLSVRPSEIAERLKQCKHVANIGVWLYPFQCMENVRRLYDAEYQRTLSPEDQQQAARLRQRLDEELRIFDLSGVVETGQRNLDIDPPFIQEMRKREEELTGEKQDPNRRPPPPRVSCVLWKGRMLQFRDAGVGQAKVNLAALDFSDQSDKNQLATAHFHGLGRTAATYLQYGRPADRHIDRWKTEMQQGQLQGLSINPDDAIESIRRGKRVATIWLGLLAFEREDYATAVEYFRDYVLNEDPNGPWARSARYNLARSLEELGNTTEDFQTAVDSYRAAFEIYDQETTSQRHGNLLRANALREKLLAITATERDRQRQAAPAPSEEPAPSQPPQADKPSEPKDDAPVEAPAADQKPAEQPAKPEDQ
jgi:tetratricopeptide (TPR) repeat protein